MAARALTAARMGLVRASTTAAAAVASPRVFSGIQPTGIIQLGNYLGAVRPWVDLQNEWAARGATRESLVFSVVDMHALTTMRAGTRGLAAATLDTAAALLACGLDPAKCVLFRQSDVLEHAHLSWLLACVTPMGALTRMTQFKDKRASGAAEVLGLFSYPVLQAADVLLYSATHVPVGEDQRQHLELARDIAIRANATFGTAFPLPEVLVSAAAPRVMSLLDGTKKMSKSDPNERSRILLTDGPDAIVAKVKRAATDSELGVTYAPATRANVANLVEIFAAVTRCAPKPLAERYASASMATFKSELADAIVALIEPIRQRLVALSADPASVAATLADGARAARAIAAPNCAAIYAAANGVRARPSA